jgi:hypothetical protein
MLGPRSIILYGPAGTGKTWRASAEFERPLRITGNCIETLRDVVLDGPRATTHLVFDEFDYTVTHILRPHMGGPLTLMYPQSAGKNAKALSVEACLTLFNMQDPGTIEARYGNVYVPPLPRLFLTNKQPHELMPQNCSDAQQAGLRRRYQTIHVTQRIWDTPPPPPGNM